MGLLDKKRGTHPHKVHDWYQPLNDDLPNKPESWKGYALGVRLLLFIAIFATILSPFHPLLTQAALPTNSTTPVSTASSPERSTFYDTVNQLNWEFYFNGTQIEYAYSANAQEWTVAGNLPYATDKFSVGYDILNNVPYAFIATECNTGDICLQEGIISPTKITWSGEKVVYNGSAFFGFYSDPVITFDNSGYIYVAAKHQGVTDGTGAEVRKSSQPGTGDLSLWDGISEIGIPNANLGDLAFVGQGTANLVLAISDNSGNLIAYRQTGGAWEPAGNGYSWFDFDKNGVYGGSQEINAAAIYKGDIFFAGNFWNASDGHSTIITDNVVRYHPATNTFSALDVRVNNVPLFGDGFVSALAVQGDDLYIGGSFTESAGVTYNHIVKYHIPDKTWSRVGISNSGGTSYGTNGNVNALVTVGNDVFVGGDFTTAGRFTVNHIAKYNPATDTIYPLGDPQNPGLDNNVTSLLIYKDGDLYIGGDFDAIGPVTGGTPALSIVRYTSTSNTFSPIATSQGSGFSHRVESLATIGNDIYIGGPFTTTADGNTTLNYIAKYTRTTDQISAIGSGTTPGLNSEVMALAADGNTLYLGGNFTASSNNEILNETAKYDVTTNQFSAVGAGTSSTTNGFVQEVHSIIVGPDSNVYFGGNFNAAGDTTNEAQTANPGYGKTLNSLAKYIPQADTLMGLSGSGMGVNGYVLTGAVHNGQVYIGGDFFQAGGITVDGIVKYDPATHLWSPVGSSSSGIVGVAGNCAGPCEVRSMTFIGNDLYIGGAFANINGVTANNVARFNTQTNTWTALGNGSLGGVTAYVNSLVTDGTNLYIGGNFPTADALTVNNVVEYTPSSNSFTALGTSTVGTDAAVVALKLLGTDLYIGGWFTKAGGLTANHIVKYSTAGNSFSVMGGTTVGTTGNVYALETLSGKLYLGGIFIQAGGVTVNRLAAYDPGTNAFSALGTGGAAEVGTDGQVNMLLAKDNLLLVGGDITRTDNVISNGIIRYDPSSNAFSVFGKPNMTDMQFTAADAFLNGDDLYVGGTYTNPGGGTFTDDFALYSKVVAPTPCATISAVTTSSDGTGILGCDGNTTTTDTWSSTPVTTSPDQICLSFTTTNKQLYFYWIKDNVLYYKASVAPLSGAGTWPVIATPLYGTGQNYNLSCSDSVPDNPIYTWTNTNPTYSVFADTPTSSTPTPTPTAPTVTPTGATVAPTPTPATPTPIIPTKLPLTGGVPVAQEILWGIAICALIELGYQLVVKQLAKRPQHGGK